MDLPLSAFDKPHPRFAKSLPRHLSHRGYLDRISLDVLRIPLSTPNPNSNSIMAWSYISYDLVFKIYSL